MFGAKRIFLTYCFSSSKSDCDLVKKKSSSHAATAAGNKKPVLLQYWCLKLVSYQAWWLCVVVLFTFEHDHTNTEICFFALTLIWNKALGEYLWAMAPWARAAFGTCSKIRKTFKESSQLVSQKIGRQAGFAPLLERGRRVGYFCPTLWKTAEESSLFIVALSCP